MLTRVFRWFATGPDRPPIGDASVVRDIYERRRWRVFIWLVIGYGFFYTCRLSLSVAKKPMLDEGILSVEQMGIIGSILLYVYAFGKFFNGILSDYANIRRFMSTALLCSALANLAFGSVDGFLIFGVLWGLNGWFQSIGSAPSVVSICQWFSNKERGTRYGVWAGAHNLGEGMTFIGTALVVEALGWRWAFWGPGLACIVIAMFMLSFLSDRPQTYGLPHVSEYRQDFSAGRPPQSTIRAQQLEVLRHPIVLVLGLSSACMYMVRYAINSWGVFFLQEGKGYSLVEAATAMAAYPVMGLLGAICSGFISDLVFGSRRNIPTLLYGLLLVGSLILLYISPPGKLWVDALALGTFGFAIGGLIVFLAGLIAVDIMPKRAAGAVKGVIGLFSYLGAATQDWISGVLIENSKHVVGDATKYAFDNAFVFWLGASVASLLLALVAWNQRPTE